MAVGGSGVVGLRRNGGEGGLGGWSSGGHHATPRGGGRPGPGSEQPMRRTGQYVANAPPMIQLRGTGPQKRLS